MKKVLSQSASRAWELGWFVWWVYWVSQILGWHGHISVGLLVAAAFGQVAGGFLWWAGVWFARRRWRQRKASK